ncbi:uncharacterized protein LOC129915511 isoform X1 [Episyrphus balteatus]|uniref:uncharacterized protein LOC129915511 isoform X1 n=1 Tax=Episyrphus balteatus TaxID=286459 RepID=UPI002485F5B3|nr:uncharacterized protein LOC129915511 isoform X1 [Episyrphus balteatus]
MAAYKKTCEISKRLSENLSSSSSSESDSDSDYDGILSSSASQYSNSTGSKSTTTTTVQRLPTRRPDPNVSNRNALLARENRRKKKEYLETLEKELDSMKHANKKLHKTLKKHVKLVKKLEHEKQYYKGLVSNQTGILDLVSVLHGKVPPQMGAYSPKQSSCSPTDSNRSSSSNFDDQPFVYDFNDDNGTNLLVDAPILSESFINDFNFFTDSDYSPYGGAADTTTNWDQLLGLNDDPLPDEAAGFFPMSRDVVCGEHNYYQSPPDSGVCLHSVEGTVSLENCLNCEKRPLQQLPEQLLVVD